MKKRNETIRMLVLSAMFAALCCVTTMLVQFPTVAGYTNIGEGMCLLAGLVLGPWYGVGVAFVASLVRNILGIGSLMAFPGSMCGALLCGVAFWKSKNLPLTLIAEVFGTGIIGGFAAYPIAKYLMGLTPAAYTVYIVPFLISTVAGSILAGILVAALRKAGVPGLAAKA